jgi:SAM-dependent methyltransferase
MKQIVKKLLRIALSPFVIGGYLSFRSADRSPRFTLRVRDFYPQIKDKTVQTGFDRHYVYHTSWAARIVAETKPAKHIDISSSLYFSGLVSAFVPVDFYDYRPADLRLSNLTSSHGDLMALPFKNDSVESISCMHTIEHIGLGRYGDPIDPEGDIRACAELSRVLAVNGRLIFVTPVGANSIIEWNAHRIYSYDKATALFPGLTLVEFSLIPEYAKAGGLVRNADPKSLKGEKYACGCFVFTKKASLNTKNE